MGTELTHRQLDTPGFLKILTQVITFDANREATAVLAAMTAMPRLLDRRHPLTLADIDESVLTGSWKHLVLRPDGVDRNAYVFAVLTAFHRHLKRRDIHARTSARWRDPHAQLLAGPAWEHAKGPAMTAMQLSDNPDELLAAQAQALDLALSDIGARITSNTTDLRVDDEGKLHVSKLHAIPEPASLIDLRALVAAMLPPVDLPEIILEVMGWVPEFT